eukprot:2374052-Rhodomonas_salina.1
MTAWSLNTSPHANRRQGLGGPLRRLCGTHSHGRFDIEYQPFSKQPKLLRSRQSVTRINRLYRDRDDAGMTQE